MSYQAIARKYRPETFAQVVGQEHVTGTLRAAMRKGKLSHAYLFCGPRGCGKTTVARLLAKALNCAEAADGDPCGTCETCHGHRPRQLPGRARDRRRQQHRRRQHPRAARHGQATRRAEGHSRVFIIDEVHMLSKGAFNALLKILEEPPARVFFFFATTEPNKIPRTILSRCQRFDFRLLSRDQLSGRMQEICSAEEVSIDPSGLNVLVSLAEGSMRDGLSLLDQAIASCEGTIDEAALVDLFGLVRAELYLELNEAMLAGDAAAALALVDRLASAGQDLVVFARGLLANFRNLLVLKVDPTLRTAVDLTDEQIGPARAGAGALSASRTCWPCSTAPAVTTTASTAAPSRASCWRRRWWSSPAGNGGCCWAIWSAPAPWLRAGGGRRRRPVVAARSRRPRRPTGRSATAGRRPCRPGGERAAEQAAPPPCARPAAGTVTDWTGFVDQVMRSNPGLASCLMTGLPDLDVAAGRLTVAFEPENGFMLRQVEANRAALEPHIAAAFGKPLRLDLMLVDAGAGPSQEQQDEVRREVAPTDVETLTRQRADDPVLDRLVGLVQGEPLPETELERWRQADAPAPDPDDDA